MPFAPINGIDLYYEVHGSGPAVLFAHGQGGNHLSWWQQIPAFSRHYTCITFDHRAFGRSLDTNERGRLSFGADAIGLLDHLQIDDVRLVAHSMGGRSALPVALRASERCRALVLCGTNGGVFTPEVQQLQRQAIAARGGQGLGAFSVAPGFREERPHLYFLLRQISRMNPPRARDFLRTPPPPGRMPVGPVHERLQQTGLPVLFVVGEHDAITPPELIETCHRLLPQSRYHLARGSGHSVYFEKPDEFNDVVLGFLRGADARRAEEASDSK